MSPPTTHRTTTWTAHPPGQTPSVRRRALTALIALALAATVLGGVPAAAEDGPVVHTVLANGEVTGWEGGPIGLEADEYAPDGSAIAVGAGGVQGAAVRLDFERQGLDAGGYNLHCRGINGTGSLDLYGSGTLPLHETSLSLHDATIDFDGFTDLAFSGRWTDGTGRTGVFVGAGWYNTGERDELYCPVPGYASDNTTFAMAFATDGNADGLPDVSDLLDELVVIDPPRHVSDTCEAFGGPRVVDATNGGVHTFVYAYQPTSEELWLCVRVEDAATGEGYGGRLKLTPTDPEATGAPGTPSFDSNSTACTTTTDPANQVPGPHPIGSGGVLVVDYLIDAYMNADEAWLCVEAGSSGYRVKVPLDSDGTGVSGTAVTWEPDEGTPGG